MNGSMMTRSTLQGLVLGLIAIGLGFVIAAGCGPKAPPRPVERQIAAPKDPPPPPAMRPQRLDPALPPAARRELDAAAASRDPFVRAHAIEAMQQVEAARRESNPRGGVSPESRKVFLAALNDSSPLVRFAASMAIGQSQLADGQEELLRMINDPDPRVGLGVRFALHRLGNTRFSRDLQDSSRDPRPAMRADTALILGLLGEPSAVRVLKGMQKDTEASVRLQVAEALWRLRSDEGVKLLVSATQSGYPDDQMVALMAMVAPRDKRITGHVWSALTADYTEVQLVAARAMGVLGSDAGYAIAAQGAKSKDPRQRWLAALAFGSMGRNDAQAYLSDLLKDSESPEVRLCAAQAILQLQTTGR